MFRYILFFTFIFLHLNSSDIYVYKIINNEITELHPISYNCSPIPSNLIINPGYYTFNSYTYDCTEAGLYRFMDMEDSCFQKIVFDGDILTYMQSLSYLHSHGISDNDLNVVECTERAKTNTLRITCGNVAAFYNYNINEMGLTSRMVCFLTLGNWNDYDNGHTLIEILQDGKWNLWDSSLGNYFTRGYQLLSGFEFIDAALYENYVLNKFTNAINYTINDFNSTDYNYEFYIHKIFYNEHSERQWYQRICQVLLINLGSNWYFTCNSEDRTRIESYNPSFVYMTPDLFLSTFYP